MSNTTYFRWDSLDGPYAGSVWSYDTLEETAKRYLRNPARAEQWAARALRKRNIPNDRREALENFLYILLARPEGASRLVEDPDFEDYDRRRPTLLERSLEVAKRWRKLPDKQKAREHLLLDFESLLLPQFQEEYRNEKLAILCELLLDHPAEDGRQATVVVRKKGRS